MMTSLKQMIIAYNARGFIIKHILADMQFECLRKTLEIQGIILNITANDEHIIKERARASINTLLIKKYPP